MAQIQYTAAYFKIKEELNLNFEELLGKKNKNKNNELAIKFQTATTTGILEIFILI